MNRQIGVGESKYEVTDDPLLMGHVTAKFWTKNRLKMALTMAMLTYKLPLIVIVAPWKLYSLLNRQIGIGESKYGVTNDPIFKDRKGLRDPILEFCDPLRISGTVEAINSKFGMQMDPMGN